MPGFEMTLSADDRWALVDYVRAHNAGVVLQQDIELDLPVRAPTFAVSCAGVAASTMADLRGHVVHVVTDAATATPLAPQGGISIVNLVVKDGVTPAPGACAAADAAAWGAYAVLADLPSDDLTGTEFLVDLTAGCVRCAAPARTRVADAQRPDHDDPKHLLKSDQRIQRRHSWTPPLNI